MKLIQWLTKCILKTAFNLTVRINHAWIEIKAKQEACISPFPFLSLKSSGIKKNHLQIFLCSVVSQVADKDTEICDKGNWKNEQKRAGSFQNELATGSRNSFLW